MVHLDHEFLLFLRFLKDEYYILLGCIYCFLLYLPFGENQRYGNSSESILCNSLKSSTFHHSIGLSTGICIPLLMNSLLDFFQPNGSCCKLNFIIRLVPLSCFIIFEILIAINAMKCTEPTEYWRLSYMQVITLLTTAYPFLHSRCPEIWTKNKISLLLGLVSLTFVFRYHDNYSLYFGSLLGILSCIFFLLSNIYFIIQYYQWYIKYALGKPIFKDFNYDMFLVWAYMNILLLFHVVWIASTIRFSNYKDIDFNIADITTLNFWLTLTIFLFSTLHCRKLRSVIQQTKVSNVIVL